MIEKLGIDLNKELFTVAFTHTSYINEHKECESYERLEFLGDKVLDFVVTEYLYKNSDSFEGDMTKIRASHVCEDALSMHSLECHFDEYLLLGKGEEKTGGRSKKAILCDIYESFVGALYLEYGLSKAKEFIYLTVISSIKSNNTVFIDYKSKLQELVQTDKEALEYVIVEETGPAHDKCFKANVVVDSIVYGTGIGKTKKDAEQQAAKDALDKMA